MTETSQWKKTVFWNGCESDTVERVQHPIPQPGSEWHRLAASVEKHNPAKCYSLSGLWSWTSRFKSRTCVANPCLWAGGWGVVVTSPSGAWRAVQSILNWTEYAIKQFKTWKLEVRVVSVYSTDGSSKVKRVHSKTKTGCYKNMILLSE